MTVSNHLTGRFLILNGRGQKIMNRDEINQDENGQNMFDHRCLVGSDCLSLYHHLASDLLKSKPKRPFRKYFHNSLSIKMG